jgi:iron(III) transport system substrate-binding protein
MSHHAHGTGCFLPSIGFRDRQRRSASETSSVIDDSGDAPSRIASGPGSRRGSMTPAVIRRIVTLLVAFLGLGAALVSTSCDNAVRHRLPPPRTVVLYTSVDDVIAQEIASIFRQEFGILVELVGDTEATKTTGLVQRLLAEKDATRADVWWSSEPLGSIRLASEGLLEPMASPPFDSPSAPDWPAELKASDGSWHAVSHRARVLVYNSKWVKERTSPNSLRDLTAPLWKGRVGMARPQFGTTRVQMAAIAAIHGPDALRRWLTTMKDNGLRLYDGNAAVVRAVAMGEIDAGLTDTDDVWAGRRNAWPLSHRYEQRDDAVASGENAGRSSADADEESPGGGRQPSADAELASLGPLLIPHTVAVMKNAPHPAEARILAEFLLSPRVERLMAELEQHCLPVRPSLAAEYPHYAVKGGLLVDWSRVADAAPVAMKICEEVLGP